MRSASFTCKEPDQSGYEGAVGISWVDGAGLVLEGVFSSPVPIRDWVHKLSFSYFGYYAFSVCLWSVQSSAQNKVNHTDIDKKQLRQRVDASSC